MYEYFIGYVLMVGYKLHNSRKESQELSKAYKKSLPFYNNIRMKGLR